MSADRTKLVSDSRSADVPEGGLVRSTNALYRKLGVGRVQKVRDGHAKVEYNPSVFMEPPYRSENKILRLSEVEKIDTPLELAARGSWGEARPGASAPRSSNSSAGTCPAALASSSAAIRSSFSRREIVHVE